MVYCFIENGSLNTRLSKRSNKYQNFPFSYFTISISISTFLNGLQYSINSINLTQMINKAIFKSQCKNETYPNDPIEKNTPFRSYTSIYGSLVVRVLSSRSQGQGFKPRSSQIRKLVLPFILISTQQ